MAGASALHTHSAIGAHIEPGCAGRGAKTSLQSGGFGRVRFPSLDCSSIQGQSQFLNRAARNSENQAAEPVVARQRDAEVLECMWV